MKKLMIAAAAATIATGAFAGLCDIQGDDSDCEAYDVTVTLKTLGDKVLKCKKTCTTGEDCIPYYVNATRKFKGILWMCEADCSFKDAQLILWRTDKGHNYAVGSLVYPDKAAKQYKALDFENGCLGLVSRYDKKATKVQMAWTLSGQETWWDKENGERHDLKKTGSDLPEYDLMFAGFGTYDTKNYVVKSVSGNVAGYAGADPTDGKCVYDYGWLVSTCAEFTDYCELDGDIQATSLPCFAAYGTWKLKYNKKYVTSGKSIVTYVPSYAK